MMTETAEYKVKREEYTDDAPEYDPNREQLVQAVARFKCAWETFKQQVDAIAISTHRRIQCSYEAFFAAFEKSEINFIEFSVENNYPWQAVAYIDGIQFFALVDDSIAAEIIERGWYGKDELYSMLPIVKADGPL